MDGKKNYEQKAEKFMADKGFYIVLTICAIVIGVSLWMLFFAPKDKKDTMTELSDVNSTAVIKEQKPISSVPDVEPEHEETVTEVPTAVYDEPEIETRQETPVLEGIEEEETVSETEEAVPEVTTYEEEPAELTFTRPSAGETVAAYAMEELIYDKTMSDWRTHDGIDIQAEMGSRVFAAAAGTVSEVYDDDMYGTTVVIDHGDGLLSVYSNLAATPTVQEGDTVRTGDTIGAVGDTAVAEIGEASHLHFAMSKDGESVDPEEYLP